jgi:WD40 repeat protein
MLAVAVGRSVSLWRPASGVIDTVLAEAPAPLTALASAPGSRWLAGLCGTGEVVVWDVKQAGAARRLEAKAVRCVALSRTGRLATGHEGSVQFWDAATGSKQSSVKGHNKAVLALAFSNGGVLVSAGADGAVKWWDADGKEMAALPVQSEAVTAVALSPDALTVATAGAGLPVRLWKRGEAKAARELQITDKRAVSALAFAPDGKTLVTGADDGAVTLWESSTGERLLDLEGKSGAVVLVFTPDGQHLAAAGKDGAVRLWNAPRE